MHTFGLVDNGVILIVGEHPASKCLIKAAKLIRRAIVSHNLVVESLNPKLVDDCFARIWVDHSTGEHVMYGDLPFQKLAGICRHLEPGRESNQCVPSERVRI